MAGVLLPANAAGQTNCFFFCNKKGQDMPMKQFTAIVHRGGFLAACLEVPGGNGQGETREECLGNLKETIQPLLDTGREEAGTCSGG
jgi:predicted RNase H-like HicB family nuclease